jgi:hypothetical protein
LGTIGSQMRQKGHLKRRLSRAAALALIAAYATAAADPANAPPPACVVSAGSHSFDLAELGGGVGTLPVRHVSRAPESHGWTYSFAACGDVVPLPATCAGAAPGSAALQQTISECFGLGASMTRNVTATATGVTLSFSGGDGGRSSVVTVECADVARPRVVRWGYGAAPGSYTALVRARAGCALECARDSVTGAVCGGAQRGSCVIAATAYHAASCICRSGYAGPLCLRMPTASSPLLLAFAPAFFPAHLAFVAAVMFWIVCARCAWSERTGCVCSTQYVQRTGIIFVVLISVLAFSTAQDKPTRIFSAFISPHQSAMLSPRWRGNNYIRDDGVLPYQLCGADEGFPGPRRSATTFSHGGRTYAAVLTATSVWGESLPSGQPLSVATLEFLVFFSEASRRCEIFGHNIAWGHCLTPKVQPAIACRFGASWRLGSVLIGHSVAVVRCMLNQNSSLPDVTDVAIALGDRAVRLLQMAPSLAAESSNKEGILTASICYEHVAATDDLVICTQPHYFDESSSFWRGNPPYPGTSTLLEAFLLHNLFVVNASRLVMHDLGSNMHKRMKPFLDTGRVKYRTNWALNDELPNVGGDMTTAFEAQAEATCGWEQRIRTRWIQILHAVDNFIMPTCFGCNVTSVLSRVNYTAVSELRVPMVEANTPALQSAAAETQNVLQRFPLLGEEWIGRGRMTPIGNPRHFNEAWIHEFAFTLGEHSPMFFRVSPLEIWDEERCIEFGLQTVHIMALSRPHLDTHRGLLDKTFGELGLRLAAQLSDWGR